MNPTSEPRRHANGALDIDGPRRLAARLRRRARREAMRRTALALRGVARPAAALLLLAGAALAQAPDFRAEPLPAEAGPDGRVLRVSILELAPGAATAPHLLPGETLVLVTAGAVLRDRGDGEPTAFVAGEGFAAEGTLVLRNPSGLPVRLVVRSLAAADELPRPAELWEGAE